MSFRRFFENLRENRRQGARGEDLVRAAQSGDVDAARSLLDEGADLHFRADQSLLMAVLEGHAPMVRFLLDRGAPAAAKDEEHDVTALMYAAQEADLEIARLLLERGADVNAFDWMGRSVWMYAQEEQPDDGPGERAEIQRLLRDAGAKETPPEEW